MRTLAREYYTCFSQPQYRLSLILSGALFACSAVVNFAAINFASSHASNSVTDLILSNTPVFRVDDPLIYGTIVVALFCIVIVLLTPRRIPFGFYALALFWLIRSLFTILTHVAPFESYYASDWDPTITHAFFGGDLFFSAHTGMPFLGFLAYLKADRRVAYIFLATSLYFAAVVLLGHLHYSIDVLAAFFITYGIFDIAVWAFPRERAWFIEK